jgi:hypothetical protein
MKQLFFVFVFIYLKSIAEANAKCRPIIVDLSITIDTSGSIQPAELRNLKSEIVKLIETIDLNDQEAYVNLINFSDQVYPSQVYLPNSQYKILLKNRIESIPYSGRSTATLKALKFVREKVFNQNRGESTPKISIIYLDGNNNESLDEIRAEAEQLKAKNVYSFVVGYSKKLNQQGLDGISSEPLDRFRIFGLKNANEKLKSEINRITRTYCDRNLFF